MLRQIELRLQNGPITKSGVLLVTSYFISLENLFQFSNVDIHIFRKRWSLILGCFFPVSNLNWL